MSKLLSLCFLLLATSVLVYSYGFLDFNLTLSSQPLFLNFVAPLQHLVYFERPRSALVYAVLFLLLFVLYRVTMSLCHFKSFPWRPFLLMVLILTLAYPMLSYDLFNYMFHSKILWFYHSNPHLHAPLEFSGDLWLRFMRWVHTPSAYGPVFTLIESPAYLLGIGKFVPVLFLMKLTMSIFFIWCIYLVGQIGKLIALTKSQIILSQLSLAFNPFLLLEVIVNGHNDAVMMTLFLYSLYFLLRSKLVPSLFALLASLGTKYVTILTLPIYWIKNPQHKIMFTSLVMLLPVIFSPSRFQPWYLVWAIIPAALINRTWARIYLVLASLAGLIYYVPYIATGFWLNTLPFVSVIIYLPIILTILLSRFGKLSL